MDKYEIIRIIENFAPLELAESWDCSGWLVETNKKEISKILLCLTVTDDVFEQALKNNCDLILSHHPLFYIPLKYKEKDIICAHTNLDKAEGGTTDTLIKKLDLPKGQIAGEFLRIVDFKISVEEFIKKLCKISPNLRYANNDNIRDLQKIAFCAGSGADFANEAFENGAEALVTGDVKFHTALESPVVLFDVGHFESEILVLQVFERLLKDAVEIIYADEKNPFKQINC